MREDKSMNAQNQLDDWLDNAVNDIPAPELEDECWQERAKAAAYIRHQAELMEECEVPNWDRGQSFGQNKNRWWQWQGIPVLSMAFSFMAIAMVILKIEFVVQPEGMMVSFSGSQAQAQEKRIAELVDQRLKQFASEQQVMLANYTSDLKSQQQNSNLQLANYLMTTARQERKEDIGELVQYVAQQMKEEQLMQKIKFNQIEQTLNYQNRVLNHVDKTVKPAYWIEEGTTDE